MLKHKDRLEDFSNEKELVAAIRNASPEVLDLFKRCSNRHNICFHYENVSQEFSTDEVESGFLVHLIADAGNNVLFDYFYQFQGLDWTKKYIYTMRSIVPGEGHRVVEHHSLSAAEYAIWLGKYNRAAKLFQKAMVEQGVSIIWVDNLVRLFGSRPNPNQLAYDALNKVISFSSNDYLKDELRKQISRVALSSPASQNPSPT